MKKFVIVMGFFLVVGYVAALVIELDPQERRPGLNLVGELAADQGTDWSSAVSYTYPVGVVLPSTGPIMSRQIIECA